MTATATGEVHFSPYDQDIVSDPYPVYRRLREEAPLYHNAEIGFYAVSRFADVSAVLQDHETYSSAKGDILELIQADMEVPSGVLIFEDPPVHPLHRRLLSRIFTPKRIIALEPQIRDFCVRSLDPLVGASEFDIIAELGAQVPMRAIGMLLGIPEAEQEAVRDAVDESLRTEAGAPMSADQTLLDGEAFAQYVDWRAENLSDDIISQLLQVEFEDETGTVRKLTRQEVVLYVTVLAGAGNETTGRLIGWTAKLLAENPGQRAELVADPTLIPGAIEEILRMEAPGHFMCRYVTRDVEVHGTTVPQGSIMMAIIAGANRDPERFPDPETFDIHRRDVQHMAFGGGIHFCLGNALARLEGRVALEELLKRFPTWDVDLANARLSSTSTVRGWEKLPLRIR
ncbi:cytochrome P450 [Cryptosporangium aurantiacum]|uniref:Cytochrome P450 n=1 Tax=Cryptosporangium aurantiacum TaxID=134849 RepID=A0A1M7TUC6_9ACTN|nr:cytochrome P450 [Cryptosporangium aurantiacum]SHN74357.1 Cytochrome P450 [Cryptosporangium aurantiacum]